MEKVSIGLATPDSKSGQMFPGRNPAYDDSDGAFSNKENRNRFDEKVPHNWGTLAMSGFIRIDSSIQSQAHLALVLKSNIVLGKSPF
jgi:hypothetical protein